MDEARGDVRACVRRRPWLAASLAVVSGFAAGCSSSPLLLVDAGADDVGRRDAGPEASTCGDLYATSSMPLDPCAVDSDCHSAYLFCGAPLGFVAFCRDADVPVSACAPPPFADAPICPASTVITDHLCGIRYQRPCNVDADCGPAFTCTSSGTGTCPAGAPCGRCDAQTRTPCVTKADCPNEWDCSAPCACTGNEPTFCVPPFEIFHCPFCGPIPAP